MPLDLSAHIIASRRPIKGLANAFYPIAPLECADGLKLSVQASRTHCCSPWNDAGPWTAFEVGYPSQLLPELAPYVHRHGDISPLCSIFGWVPEPVILAILEAHGGIVDPLATSPRP